MGMREEMEQFGGWMFRWRSFLPILALVLLIPAMLEFRYFMGSESGDRLWDLVCIGISFTGLAIRIITIGYTPAGTSGRNTEEQIAEELNTSGIYSIVRHPLYLGNFFMWMGVALFPHHFLTALLVAAVYFIYYERIMLAEEAFLRKKFGAQFETWAARTPAIVPRFRNWQKPSLPFSFRNVLKREYSGFYGIVVAFTALELLGEYEVRHIFYFETEWIIFLSTGTAIYILLRWLKKNTRVLHVPGR